MALSVEIFLGSHMALGRVNLGLLVSLGLRAASSFRTSTTICLYSTNLLTSSLCWREIQVCALLAGGAHTWAGCVDETPRTLYACTLATCRMRPQVSCFGEAERRGRVPKRRGMFTSHLTPNSKARARAP